MTEKPKLEPCPACQQKAEYFKDSRIDKNFSVECVNEKCMRISTPFCETLKEAASIWNTRVPTDFEVKAKAFLQKILSDEFIRDDLLDDIEKFLEENP